MPGQRADRGADRGADRFVDTRDARLAVFERGDPDAPTVLLVHGYPDTHRVWDPVAERLARRFHVVSYDTRGAGASTGPRGTHGYRTPVLADDLFAVLDAVSPAAPVHVVGHDWGSVQAWEAVTDPVRAGRIASFTSISGPCLDHVGHWIRRRLRRPTPANLGAALRQLVSSAYIIGFHVPVLSTVVWPLLAPRLWPAVRRREGLTAEPSPTLARDARRGLALYRANIVARLLAPRQRRTTVAVQVVSPTDDPYVRPALLRDVEQWAPRLWRRRIVAGHWAPLSRPDVLVRQIEEFVEHIGGGPVSRSLRRARVGERGGVGRSSAEFTGSLVVVTGAGSGIGRATARLFAGLGAEVVVADLRAETAEETAELIGPAAHPYVVDVADGAAMRTFADQVAAVHGVPDVVVNNAGIGLAGPFLDTTDEQWRRVLDVNLLGVVNGCRLFGRQMADAGEGGHIVNIASAAAYTPSRVLPAYAASKSAVLMLSECLRGELARDRIGVSAICPGIVHTNITVTSTFAGVDADEQDRLRRTAFAAYGRRGFGPERVAAAIVGAVRDNAAVVPVTPEAKLGLVASRLVPAVMRAGARIDPTASRFAGRRSP